MMLIWGIPGEVNRSCVATVLESSELRNPDRFSLAAVSEGLGKGT